MGMVLVVMVLRMARMSIILSVERRLYLSVCHQRRVRRCEDHRGSRPPRVLQPGIERIPIAHCVGASEAAHENATKTPDNFLVTAGDARLNTQGI
jgi:hypothetical protein